MPALTVVVCGHVTVDRLGDSIVAGGSAYYAARTLAALGAHPRVLTAAGPDFPADALASIETRIAPAARTTSFVNSYSGGRRAQRVLAAAPPLEPAFLPDEWAGPDALLVAPVLGECDAPAFAAAARARVVGVCVQGLVREVSDGGAVALRPLPPAAVRGAHVAFLGEDDAGEPDVLARRLAAEVPLVVLTRGARGCEVHRAGRVDRVGACPAIEVDPTGAGDVFAAAFLLVLAKGGDPVDAARLGAAAAAIAVEGRGGEALGRVGEATTRAAGLPAGREPPAKRRRRG